MSLSVNEIFSCLSGNSGLTEEFIYNQLQKAGERYKVLSGSTDSEGILGEIPSVEIKSKTLKLFSGKQGILVARKGKAGSMRYLPEGKYTLNDDAYILYLKDSFKKTLPDKVDEATFLEWYVHAYQSEVIQYSSSSDNGTWNKTNFFKNSFIEMPSSDEILKVIDIVRRIEDKKGKISKALSHIDSFLAKPWASNRTDLTIYKLNQLFYINQGHQITDQELYQTEGLIPVYTGSNEIKGYWDKSIITEKDLPCITYPTKANNGIAYIQDKIFDANNTAVLIPKDEWREKLVLEWFIYRLPILFLESMTSKEGVSYLNKDLVEVIEVALPSKEEQEKEVVFYRKIAFSKERLNRVQGRINEALSKKIVFK